MKYIINFFIKKYWCVLLKLVYIDVGFIDFICVICEFNIVFVVVFLLGVGNGGLDWEDVE